MGDALHDNPFFSYVQSLDEMGISVGRGGLVSSLRLAAVVSNEGQARKRGQGVCDRGCECAHDLLIVAEI